MEPTRRSRAVDLGPTGLHAARNLNRIRQDKGFSLKELADRVSGVDVTADTISKMETRQRRIHLDQLTALAAALDVNPSALLLPPVDDEDQTIEVTGAKPQPADRAWDWADGHRPLITTDDEDSHQAEFELRARPPKRRLLWAGIGQLGATELFDRLTTAQLRRLARTPEQENDQNPPA